MATGNKTHNCTIILPIQKKKLKGNLHKLETLFNKEKFLFVFVTCILYVPRNSLFIHTQKVIYINIYTNTYKHTHV